MAIKYQEFLLELYIAGQMGNKITLYTKPPCPGEITAN